MKVLTGCLFIMLLIGCTSEPQSKYLIEEAKLRNERIKMQYEACIKLGGIPIYSRWKEGIETCQFPPK